MGNEKIPLSAPLLRGNEWKYIRDCLDTSWVSTAGSYVSLFEKKIVEKISSKFAIACINGTSSLHIALKIVGVKPNDEVIVPSLTFIAPVNAVAYVGAHPVFMDSDSYYNIDSEKTIDFIQNHTFYKDGFTYNKKTKRKISAIVPVHVWGNACFLDDIIEICYERNIMVVEDASESLGTKYLGGKYKNKTTGSLGNVGCLSFNGNKIITSGSGGMILTDSDLLAKKSSYLITQAKDDPIKYIHNDIGYNYRLSNVLAALGLAQLEQLDDFISKKLEIHKNYQTALANIPGLKHVKTPSYSLNNHWLNVIKIDKNIYGSDKESLMHKMRSHNIETRPVWHLNHLQNLYKNYFSFKIENALKLQEVSLCLPSSVSLKKEDIDRISNVMSRKND